MSLELWVDDKLIGNVLNISKPSRKQLSAFGGSFGSRVIYTALVDAKVLTGIGAIKKYEIRDEDDSRLIEAFKSRRVGSNWTFFFEYKS